MTPGRYPPSDANRANGCTEPGETAPSPASDDRPTTPPPFDVEALARGSVASNYDLASLLEATTSRHPQLELREEEGARDVTARPVTLAREPTGQPPARPGKTFTGIRTVLAFGIVALGIAAAVEGSHMRAAARARFATSPVVAAPPSAPAPAESPPDLPIALTVVRPAAVPSGARGATPRAGPPSSRSAVLPECQPPYVIDAATGKKRWKLDCL